MRAMIFTGALALGLGASACTLIDVRVCGSDDNPTCLDAAPIPDGGEDGGGPDAGHTPDAGPCGMECTGTTPYCDEALGRCVRCTEATVEIDCSDSSVGMACVEGECTACTDDDQCAARTDTPVCDEASGWCVPCTPDTEEARCGANACDPVSFECTSTPRGALQTCFACLADSECAGDRKCVELKYMGESRGHYCMPPVPSAGCSSAPAPFRVALVNRRSRSGEVATNYCGINEERTTCEAVIAALSGGGVGCTAGTMTACPEGGRCATVGPMGAGGNRCTYDCEDMLQCPAITGLATCPLGGGYCGET